MNRGGIAVAIVGAVIFFLSVAGLGQDGEADALIPGALSLGLPGVGQFMIGDVDAAVLHFGVAIGLWAGSALVPYPISSFFWIAPVAWHLYSGYDAYTRAQEQGFRFGFSERGVFFSYSF